MAYNIIIQKETDIKHDIFQFPEYRKLLPDDQEAYRNKVKGLFKEVKGLGDPKPLAIDPKQKVIKVSRVIQNMKGMNSESFLKTLRTTYASLSLKYGNGSSGRKYPSGGSVFETKILQSLQAWNDGDDKIEDENLKKFVVQFTKRHKIFRIGRIDIQRTGQRNVSRPLKHDGGNFYIKEKGIPNVGQEVADITIYQDETKTAGKAIFLSLKFGEETSFFNAGIKTFIPTEFFTEDKELEPKGQQLLDFFGLDKDKFKETFVSYKKPVAGERRGSRNNRQVERAREIGPASSQVMNMSKIQDLVSSGIGYGYYLVEQKIESAPVNFMFLTQQATKGLSSFVGRPAEIYYGGKQGKAKKVLIEFENRFMRMRIDIRSTSEGGLYPEKILGYITWLRF